MRAMDCECGQPLEAESDEELFGEARRHVDGGRGSPRHAAHRRAAPGYGSGRRLREVAENQGSLMVGFLPSRSSGP